MEERNNIDGIITFIVVLVLLVWLLMGCCPCKHLATSTQDSLRVEVVERIVEVRDTAYIDMPSIRDSVNTMARESHLENEYAFSDAAILANGSLSHTLQVRPRTVQIQFKKPIIHRDSIVYRNSYRTVTVEVERALTWWQQTQIRGFWVMLIFIAVLAAIWRVKRRFF
jgi:hypothetical protein